MVPFIRLVRNSWVAHQFAARIGPRERRNGQERIMSGEEAACELAALLSMMGALAICSWYGFRHCYKVWWLTPVIFLGIMYASYAARYEHGLWYPYDFPHLLIFGAACVCILTERPRAFFVLFLIDLPFRETSIYLILLSLAFTVRRLSKRQAVLTASCMFLCWLAVRLAIVHRFHGNPSEMGGRMIRNLKYAVAPGDTPTVLSALGFLLIPVWLAKKRLNAVARWFLWLSLPCFLITFYFGMLIETRIFVEWTIPFAVLATQELISYLELASWAPNRLHAQPSKGGTSIRVES